MAYVSKEKKEKIRAELRKVIPMCWKWSLAVNHGSTAVLTIYSAPVNLPAIYAEGAERGTPDYLKGGIPPSERVEADVNPYWFKEHLAGTDILPVFEKIVAAMNIDNFDKSDLMTDYHHVGHYVTIRLGKWNKPFVVTGDKEKEAA